MRRKAIAEIKDLCTGEIKFCSSDRDSITILVPCEQNELIVNIVGNTVEEQVESFISAVNQILDDMIDHLGDCKL